MRDALKSMAVGAAFLSACGLFVWFNAPVLIDALPYIARGLLAVCGIVICGLVGQLIRMLWNDRRN
jgi:hypothetical protein